MIMASRTATEDIQIASAFRELLDSPEFLGEAELPLVWPSRVASNTAGLELLNIREVAARLSVHENTVRNWIQKGFLRAARLPGSGYRRVPVVEVERLRQGAYGNLAPMNTGPVIETPADLHFDIVHTDQNE